MPVRAILFDRDDAWAVAHRLRRDGFAADVQQDRLAGEDDDEDHPWAVVTDAPTFAVEVLIETYDGWLDLDADHGPDPGPPLPLPTGPRH